MRMGIMGVGKASGEGALLLGPIPGGGTLACGDVTCLPPVYGFVGAEWSILNDLEVCTGGTLLLLGPVLAL